MGGLSPDDTYSVNRGLRSVILIGNITHMDDTSTKQNADFDPLFDGPKRCLGDVIREAREAREISRSGLARLIGVSHNSMLNYEKAGHENGQYPPLLIMVKLADRLDLDPRIIFDFAIDDTEIEQSSNNHFSDKWRSNVEWIDYSMSIKNAETLNDSVSDIAYHLYSNDQKIDRILKMLGGLVGNQAHDEIKQDEEVPQKETVSEKENGPS